MPRRKNVEKREVLPDPKFNNKLVTKFINCLMRDGKKSLAESIFYKALDIIQTKLNEDPLQVFKQAVQNAKPVVEVKSRRVGGSTYQIPVDVRPARRVSLSIRWLINFARQRKEHTMQERLAAELLDAYHNRGTTIKKKEDTHRMAEANKAFAHYRW
jgi:small subunit ribosomal protein S7